MLSSCAAAAPLVARAYCGILGLNMATEKTFYLETFGCQMNVHDSEKVSARSARGLPTGGLRIAADLILYNTCSIRDKAEQKVFNRLNDYKKLYARANAS